MGGIETLKCFFNLLSPTLKKSLFLKGGKERTFNSSKLNLRGTLPRVYMCKGKTLKKGNERGFLSQRIFLEREDGEEKGRQMKIDVSDEKGKRFHPSKGSTLEGGKKKKKRGKVVNLRSSKETKIQEPVREAVEDQSLRGCRLKKGRVSLTTPAAE